MDREPLLQPSALSNASSLRAWEPGEGTARFWQSSKEERQDQVGTKGECARRVIALKQERRGASVHRTQARKLVDGQDDLHQRAVRRRHDVRESRLEGTRNAPPQDLQQRRF
jgi:hypothetical protein